MTPRVFFYVQHLLGIGHLVRAARIARALGEAGLRVDLVMGGEPVSGLDCGGAALIQLPPLKAGPHGFSELVTAAGAPADEAFKRARCQALLDAFDAAAPDILLIEAFPFGRRQMRFELLPLLARAGSAQPRPLIACSVRDILQENRKPGRDEETAALVEAWFDLVLVHGDERIARLADSFPLAGRFSGRVKHTGLVGPSGAPAGHQGQRYAVTVSAGGGAAGASLLRAALQARSLTAAADAPWLVVVGPNASESQWQECQSLAAPNVELHRFLPDLPLRLRQTRVSVSQVGYNTVADLLAAGCACILVPFAAGGETEQTRRAGILAARGLALSLSETALTPHTLAALIDQAAAMPQPVFNLALDGAPATARLLLAELSARRSA